MHLLLSPSLPSTSRSLWHHGATLLPHRRTRKTRTFSQLSTLNFNISHCKSALAVAVADAPIGIDVECIGRYREPLARRVLNDSEYALVSQSPDPQIPFTRFWTQKEALVKLTGRGIDDDLPNLLLKYNNVSLHTEEHLDKGYILTVATFPS